jgi:hypothetical protein
LLYWNSDRGIERMSMDGNNRTAIINVTKYRDDAILFLSSFTLDYQTQVLYWVFHINDSDDNLIIERSNVDGTNQQTILRLQNVYYYDFYYYYYHHHRYFLYLFSSGLTVYNETLFLSLSWTRELYKIGMNGDALPFINNSAQVFCRFVNYQLRVTTQPSS